jgi:hypothetical protein
MPLLVEMGFGGLVTAPETITWTDVSRSVDVVKQGVTITRGAADELSEIQPGTPPCAWTTRTALHSRQRVLAVLPERQAQHAGPGQRRDHADADRVGALPAGHAGR